MNRKLMLRRLLQAMLLVPVAWAAQQAHAQGYPSKPIRFIIPFAPGGTTDIVARLVGQKLTEAWGQTVVVESRPGANGILAAEATKAAAPDGHTMFMAVLSTHATNPFLYAKLSYDPIKDFTPVAGIADFQQRFGRPPAGMWLPETAVDLESLDLMAEQGYGDVLFFARYKRQKSLASELFSYTHSQNRQNSSTRNAVSLLRRSSQ